MEKLIAVRSLCRSICSRRHIFSSATSAAAATSTAVNHHFRHLHFNSPSVPSSNPNSNHLHPFAMRFGGTRPFREDVVHMPAIKDPEIERAFKDLMAVDWNELPPAVVHDVKEAISKNTDDNEAQEVLKNVFRAAEAIEEFGCILISLKMELDDSIGASGENVKPLTEDYVEALKTVFSRYNTYLESFGPEEIYLRKKVEKELGTKMIYLKMRCGGLNADWGKVTVLGTSGLAGSYIEQRA